MAWREFEDAAPGENQVVIVGDERPLRYIRKAPVRFCSLRRLSRQISEFQCKAVIFHSLPRPRYLRHVPSDVTVIWLGWGFDYYGRLLGGDFPQGLLLPETKALVEQDEKGLVSSLLRVAVNVKRRLYRQHASDDQELLSRVNYFAPVLDTEYEMAVRLNDWFKPGYLEWNYGTVEDDLGGDQPAPTDVGENILVGNAADPLNNHLEVFDLLQRCVDIGDRKIVVPLSYGDDWYRDKVIEHGKRVLGENFMPIVDFLDADAYRELLQSCGFVFMNHLRQSAMANICMTMLMGAKIYLNPLSPAYRWLRNAGCTLSSIESLRTVLEPISAEERLANVQAINNQWGRDAKLAKTRHVVNVALGVA